MSGDYTVFEMVFSHGFSTNRVKKLKIAFEKCDGSARSRCTPFPQNSFFESSFYNEVSKIVSLDIMCFSIRQSTRSVIEFPTSYIVDWRATNSREKRLLKREKFFIIINGFSRDRSMRGRFNPARSLC